MLMVIGILNIVLGFAWGVRYKNKDIRLGEFIMGLVCCFNIMVLVIIVGIN